MTLKPIRLLAFTALLLLSIVALAALIALLAPTQLLVPAANYYLDDLQAELSEVKAMRIGRRGASLSTVTLTLPGLRISASELSADYRFEELLSGRLRTLSVGLLRIEPLETEAAQEDSNLSLAQALQSLQELPLDRIRVDELRVDGLPLHGEALSLETRAATFAAELVVSQPVPVHLQLAVRERDGGIEGSGVVSLEQTTLLESFFAIAENPQGLELTLEAETNRAGLQSLPQWQEQLQALALEDETLALGISAVFADSLTAPLLYSAQLDLAGAEAGPGVVLETDSGTLRLTLDEPVQARLDRDADTGQLDLRVSELNGRLNLEGEPATFNGGFTVAGLQGRCRTDSGCDLAGNLALEQAEWQLDALGGSNTNLSAGLQATPSGEGWLLQSPTATLLMPELRFDGRSAGGELRLSDTDLLLGADLALERASTELAATRLLLPIEGLQLNRPRLDANLTLDDGQIQAEGSFTVNNRISLGLDVAHELGADTAESHFELSPVQFSDSAALSDSIAIEELDLELLAGSVAGEAILDWRQTEAGWQPRGDVRLRVDSLGGAWGQWVFAGLETALAVQVDATSLRTEGLLPGSLRSIDFGLPLGPIEWQYAFDSEERSVTVSNLITQVFGGTVEVAHFKFDADNERNLLEIIIAGLDLAELVALADYPNVQVEGEISGYVPIQIDQDGQIIIEDGLVSALRPGGSIRYIPTDPDSANPSVQLINDALSNYQFETLNAEVDYLDNGDLVMGLQLRGNNPELGEQPINLNVTITDNIPSLIRSLQAARRITERLEQQLNR